LLPYGRKRLDEKNYCTAIVKHNRHTTDIKEEGQREIIITEKKGESNRTKDKVDLR
jgi:hypothetical protein